MTPARLLLIALLVTSCGRNERLLETSFPGAPVILISVDTLRSDHLPAYGYKGDLSTPNFDRLRREGILYQRVYSQAPLTLPSHASMLTGLLPGEHGVRNNIGYRLDPARARTLARILREKGYRTGAAVSSYVLRSETGISDGFDFYEDSVGISIGGATSEHQRSGFETVKVAQRWVESNAPSPFFFFLHLYEPHAPYTPPEPFKSRVADAYDGEIAAADAAVGELLASLKRSGLYDRSIIVLTSDHGEALWQHGEDQHGILLYREVLQVPLIIKLPNSTRGGTTVSELKDLRSLFDEILRLVGIDTVAKTPLTAYSETFYPRIHLGWSELTSLIEGNYHYIESSSPELYDLQVDPGESKNIIDTERRVALSMRRKLASLAKPLGAPERIDPEEAKKLAALGYIGTPQNRSGPLPNPREQIGSLKEVRHAFELAAARRNDEAIEALRALLKKQPRFTDIATRLGEVLTESGRYDEAINVYRETMQRSERFSPDLALALALTYLKAGRTREATAHAELAMSVNPIETRQVLARAAVAERRFGDAEAQIRLVLDASRQHPRLLVLYAELQRDRGDLEAAQRTIDEAGRRAKELGIEMPYNLEHLRGDVLARLDRPDEAVAAYEREIAAFPQHLQSYANLALIHFIMGDRAEGERVLERMVRVNPHRGAKALAAKTRNLGAG